MCVPRLLRVEFVAGVFCVEATTLRESRRERAPRERELRLLFSCCLAFAPYDALSVCVSPCASVGAACERLIVYFRFKCSVVAVVLAAAVVAVAAAVVVVVATKLPQLTL